MNNTIFERLVSHIQSKGIIISDIKRLMRFINDYNYNRVMKQYLKFIEYHNIQKFNITTDDILNLYELDINLSAFLLHDILEIEKKLNTQIAYAVEDAFKIYDGCLFKLNKHFIRDQIFSNVGSKNCQMSFEQFINKITKYAHINPNTTMYEDVSKNNLFLKWKNCPFDALCLSWTFNTTVLVYYALNDNLKTKIIRYFKLSPNKIKIFNTLLEHLIELRNTITHNNVIFGHEMDSSNGNALSNIFNEIFNERKKEINFLDFSTIIEYFSNNHNLNKRIYDIFKMYKFSNPTIQEKINNFFIGKKHGK